MPGRFVIYFHYDPNGQADNACLILKVKEDEAAEALLEKEGVRSLSEQELNTL